MSWDHMSKLMLLFGGVKMMVYKWKKRKVIDFVDPLGEI